MTGGGLRGWLNDTDEELRSIHADIRTLLRAAGLEIYLREHTMDTLDQITLDVAATETVEQSAVVLIAGIVDELRRVSTSPAAIQDLANRLEASNAPLAAAVAAVPDPNAPPAPAPVVEPVPAPEPVNVSGFLVPPFDAPPAAVDPNVFGSVSVSVDPPVVP